MNGVERLLIDIGLPYRQVVRRLESLGVEPDSIRGILITHAHLDHVQGAARFARRHRVPIYGTGPTFGSWRMRVPANFERVELRPGARLDLCGLRIHPFPVPHDAAETVGFRIETPRGAIGFATDIGTVTPALAERFRDCVVLVIESNHSTEMLRIGPYAQWMKSRIGGPTGHLSNEALADFIERDLGDSVRCVVLAHLSRINNVPEIAAMTCRDALRRRGREEVHVVVARQEEVAETVDLGMLSAACGSGQGESGHRQVGLPFA